MAVKNKKKVADALSVSLASTYTLYLKTQNFHWNVTGPYFSQLHALFMTQYSALALAVDEIAERIRTLGYPAPGSYAAFGKLSVLKDAPAAPIKDKDMLKTLLADQEAVRELSLKGLKIAQAEGDELSADLFIKRAEEHDKTAWMLRSHLQA